MNKYFLIILSFIFLSELFSCKQAQSEYIFYKKDGSIIPTIVIPDKPKGIETKAAQFFIENFKQFSTKNILIINEAKAKTIIDKPLLYIGNTTESKLYSAVKEKIKWDGFAFLQHENKTCLIANDDMGLLYGANAFFEHQINMYYVDNQEKFIPENTDIIIKENEWIYNPDFMIRSAYFPQSQDINYNLWNGTQTLEEKWNIWGHNLNKLVDGKIVGNDQSIYALINGKRNDAQYCFSSNKLFEALKLGIQKKINDNPDATYFSISPNDNGIICECENCKKINQPKSASNAVFLLVNKLAKQFPDLMFTSLAYSTTNKPPVNIKLEKNTAVLISTINYPKGISIIESPKEKEFSTWISDWKKSSENIFVWDYAIQYTNFFDVFPNMPALQKDLQYFKKLGITGVFEQGSEEKYSLFGDYKSYVISKLLWNTDLDLEKLKYDFFENAYPTTANNLAEFVTQTEKKLQASKKTLDIYGNITQTLKNYLSLEEFDLFYYELMDKQKEAYGSEIKRNEKINVAFMFDKLEMLRYEGFSENGYAFINGSGERIINNETNLLLEKLKNTSLTSQIFLYSEIEDSINSYLNLWKSKMLEKEYKSAIANKDVTILSKFDDSFIGNAAKSFTNGSIGFLDYSMNWLLFNNKMEVEIPISTNFAINKLSLSFLKDAKHYIFLPQKIEVFGRVGNLEEKIGELSLTNSNSLTKEIKDVSINFSTNKKYTTLKIIAYNITQLPEWAFHPTRKPTLACDEILMY